MTLKEVLGAHNLMVNRTVGQQCDWNTLSFNRMENDVLTSLV